MASRELVTNSKPATDQNEKDKLLQQLASMKEKATDYLVFRDFYSCKKTCENGIALAKLFTEHKGAQDYVESLCLLCIQAIAELNNWQDVLPLVQDVYSGIETCPYSVIQLCILLHARVKEYGQCHAVASIWLRCEDNSRKPGYRDVAMLYIKHAMIPQQQTPLIPQFLLSCTHLEESVRDKMVRDIEDEETIRKSKASAISDRQDTDRTIEGDEEESCQEGASLSERPLDHDLHTPDNVTRLLSYARRFGVWLARKFSFLNLQTVMNVAMVSVCFYFAAIKANQDDLVFGLGRGSTVWQGAINILKSMFAPQRPNG